MDKTQHALAALINVELVAQRLDTTNASFATFLRAAYRPLNREETSLIFMSLAKQKYCERRGGRQNKTVIENYYVSLQGIEGEQMEQIMQDAIQAYQLKMEQEGFGSTAERITAEDGTPQLKLSFILKLT